MHITISRGKRRLSVLVTQYYQNFNSSELLLCTLLFSKLYGSYWKSSSLFTCMDNLGKFDSGFYLACTACMPGDLEICFKSLPC